MSRRLWVGTVCLLAGLAGLRAVAAADLVVLERTPGQGIQPQAVVDGAGTLHVVYFRGEPAAGDLFHVTRAKGAADFSQPVQVNSGSKSAIAVGTIRGAQIAVGQGNRLHVAWNGSGQAVGANKQNPMLYTRLTDEGQVFEPQRDLIHEAYGLDGGGSVAADTKGNVYVAWHANPAKSGENNRRIYLAVSHDEGQTFAAEKPVDTPANGACGCCGLKAFVDDSQSLSILYRGAKTNVNRDTFLLRSDDQGQGFDSKKLDVWSIAACPMSSFSMVSSRGKQIEAWETDGQIFFETLDERTGKTGTKLAVPGAGRGRKHPSLAVNSAGQILVAWTEGTGWQRGGALAWQVFDAQGKPTKNKGRVDGVPVWGLPAAVTLSDGRFLIIY